MKQKKKKTVCFFSGDITRCGGTERVSTIIANELAKRGEYQVMFLSIVEQNDFPAFYILPEINRYVLRDNGKWIQPGLGYLPLVPVLRRFFIRYSIDIIVDIDIVLDALSIPASVNHKVKIISWEHFHYYYEQKNVYRRMILRFSALFSDYIITLTEQDKENFRKKLHRYNRITAVYNPIDTEMAGNIDGSWSIAKEKMLITVGSFNKRKGTDMIAQVIPDILCKYKEWKWYFLGDGEYREVLEEVVCKYHLEEQLILTGNVPNVEDYLKRASIYIMSSRIEGLPMCLLEAKAFRIPCISFDIQTGPSEIIINGVNGFLIPPFDLSMMMQKIILLIENEDLRSNFSKKMKIGLEKFQLESIILKWEQLLEFI